MSVVLKAVLSDLTGNLFSDKRSRWLIAMVVVMLLGVYFLISERHRLQKSIVVSDSQLNFTQQSYQSIQALRGFNVVTDHQRYESLIQGLMNRIGRSDITLKETDKGRVLIIKKVNFNHLISSLSVSVRQGLLLDQFRAENISGNGLVNAEVYISEL